MSLKLVPAMAVLLTLGACGGSDPTPDRADAASGAEVNAAVNVAQAEMEVATNKVEARQEAEARGAEAAKESIARSDAAESNNQSAIPPMQ